MLASAIFCFISWFVIVAKADSGFCVSELFLDSSKGCSVIQSVVIGTKYFEIEGNQDEDVQSINFQANKNVSFLPIKMFQKFPSLRIYSAERCNIGEISLQNFEYLFHVKELNLLGNRIQTVRRDTFMYLVTVRTINLSKLVFRLVKTFRRKLN